jgi:murein DD-endopeptidase MepM/ murein hydrolase activator NlpD
MVPATLLTLAAAGAVIAPSAAVLAAAPAARVAAAPATARSAPAAESAAPSAARSAAKSAAEPLTPARVEPPAALRAAPSRPPSASSEEGRRTREAPVDGWHPSWLAGPGVVAAGHGWAWPLDPEPAVVATFRAPPTPWGAGHRGVDLAAVVGQPVRAAGGGRVTFAGKVAGRGVVVVTHPGGLRTSYEPVGSRAPVGTAVGRGDRVGVVAATPGHCAPRTCLHWGLRRGSQYVDPLTLVGRGPPVLLPMS